MPQAQEPAFCLKFRRGMKSVQAYGCLLLIHVGPWSLSIGQYYRRGWRFEWRKGKGWLPKTRECLFYERKRA